MISCITKPFSIRFTYPGYSTMPSNDEKCTLTKSLVHFEQKLFVYRNTKNARIFA